MAKFKNPVNKIKLHEINYAIDKTVSYSQYSIWRKCPYQWYLNYVKGEAVYTPTIHTVFGTSMHEAMQKYIDMIYNVSGKKADEFDIELFFKERFTENYKSELDINKKTHFSSPGEMKEFYEDGLAILSYFKKNRAKYLGIRQWKLIGIEVPIIEPIPNKQNMYMKGFIDFILYDEKYDRYYIFDIKTSTRGWSAKEKKDDIKINQILLYKQYFSDLYKIDIDKVEVEFLVVRRKVWDSEDFVIGRVQEFKPAAGKIKMKKANTSFQSFLDECFNSDGTFVQKDYPKIVSKDTCRWCPYNNLPNLCNKNIEQKQFFS